MILRVQQGLLDEGVKASLSQLCRWFEVPRRTVYYQSTKAAPEHVKIVVASFMQQWVFFDRRR